jgi:hypothetical protein
MIKSAAELREIAKEQRERSTEALRAQDAEIAAKKEARVSGYYDKMLAIIESLSTKEIAVGYIEVYEIIGDYTVDGSLDKVEGYSGSTYPGLEEAWTRLRATLEAQGYHLVRLMHTVSTGGYDNPYRDYTEFVVEWNAPWIFHNH